MNEFEPLSSTVEPHFDKKFDGLPSNLRKAVRKVISKLEWDRSSPQQRARKMFWHDLRRDPQTDKATLVAHGKALDKAESLEAKLIGAARARWNLKVERIVKVHWFITNRNISSKAVGDVLEATDIGDLSAIERAFRVWFWKWWREHNQTAPSLKEVETQFGRSRSIGRRTSFKFLKLMRTDVRQKVGQKGTSKRDKQPTK